VSALNMQIFKEVIEEIQTNNKLYGGPIWTLEEILGKYFFIDLPL